MGRGGAADWAGEDSATATPTARAGARVRIRNERRRASLRTTLMLRHFDPIVSPLQFFRTKSETWGGSAACGHRTSQCGATAFGAAPVRPGDAPRPNGEAGR